MEEPWNRRSDALGRFQVLSDEIICCILELLEAKDLSILSCVSSVFYIFCNEDPLWMKLCLNTHEGLLRYSGTWKHTVLQKITKDNGATHALTNIKLHFDGFSSVFLYRRWYRSNADTKYFGVDKGMIDRKHDLSFKEFVSTYDGKKPVLLGNLADRWPAMQRWNIDYLTENFGKCVFKVGEDDDKKLLMSFEDYAFYMMHQHDENPLYIFDAKFGEIAPSLIEDYEVPEFFKEDLFSFMDDSERPPFRWLVIGPPRSGASWHVDPALTSAWNTLIRGRKRWVFYPPGHVPPSVTIHVDEDGDMATDSPSSLQWWLDVYPALKEEDKPLECIQNPGETIFVPSGWWHCVLNLETSVAVTQNFVNSTNFELVCIDLTPGYHHRGVARAGKLALHEYMLASVDSSLESYTNGNGDKMTMKGFYETDWSFTVEFLSSLIDHHSNSSVSKSVKSGYVKSQTLRKWLNRLWLMRPDMRQLIWKGACIAFDAEGWLEQVVSICNCHNLPPPTDEEKLPVGNGSNPVFLVGCNAIKLYLDETSQDRVIDGLSSELQFYSELQKSETPLKHAIPNILASGVIYYGSGVYKVVEWDGRNAPKKKFQKIHQKQSTSFGDFHRARWNQAAINPSYLNFCENDYLEPDSVNPCYPYIITSRYDDKEFSYMRKTMNERGILDFSSFLGEQIKSLHCLPLPQVHSVVNGKSQQEIVPFDNHHKPWAIKVMGEWALFIGMMRRQQRDIVAELEEWEIVPNNLIKQVEDYLPADPVMLVDINTTKPVWLHMDVNDENILVKSSKSNDADKIDHNIGKIEGCCILDFGDVCLGDPLYEMVPIFLDVFRGDVNFMNQFLASYNLPLTSKSNELSKTLRQPANPETAVNKLSYRAMCYSILHEDNALGAIFSIWKELKTARSWKEIEQRVWGFLEEYENSTSHV